MRNGDLDRAIADYTEAIQLDPNYARAYLNRGIARLAKGDLENAIADFGDVIRLDPKDATAHYNRGRASLYRGVGNTALADLSRAAELDPTNAHYVLWIDVVAHRAKAPGQLSQLPTAFDKSRWPAPVFFLFLGQSTPAAVLAAAADKNPARQREQVCEAHLYIGHWALRRGDRREAARQFRMAANECPRHLIEFGIAQAELRALGEVR
jgi:lipoprotein NlpI